MNALGIRGRLGVLAVFAAVMAIGVPGAGAATMAPTSHNFGDVSVGGSSLPQTFTVTNGCSAMLGAACVSPENSPITPTVSGAGFSLQNLCPAALTINGQTCRLNVVFTPSGAGDANGTLLAGGGLTASLTATGVDTAPKPKKCKKKKKKKKGAAAAKKKCKKKK